SSRMDWTSSPMDRWVGGVLGSFVVLIMVGAYRREKSVRRSTGWCGRRPGQSTEMRLRLVVSGRGPADRGRSSVIDGATATSRVGPSWPETRSTRNWAASAPRRSELGSTLVSWETPEEAREVLP